MNVSTEALNLLLLFLPGAISSWVLTTALRRRTPEPLHRLLEAIAFTLATTTLLALAGAAIGAPPVLPPLALEAGRLAVRDGGGLTLAALLMLAVLLPLPIARALTRDRHMALLRRLGITTRTSRDSTWEDVFTEQGDRFVVLELADGRRLQGYPRYWSDNPEEGFVYLSRPAWLVRTEGEGGTAADVLRDTGQHGLLIHRGELRWVEFQPRMPHDRESPEASADTVDRQEERDG